MDYIDRALFTSFSLILVIGTSTGCGPASDELVTKTGRAKLSSESITFRRTAIGEPAVEVFRIGNVGTGELRVSGVELIELQKGEFDGVQEIKLPHPASVPKLATISPGSSFSVLLQYTPTNRVRDEGLLRFHLSDPDLPTVEIPLVMLPVRDEE